MDSNSHDPSPMSSVIFIAIPEEYQHNLESMPGQLPGMLPVDTGGDPASWSPEELTWEMIVSGMLKILAHQPEHDDVDYYRQFIQHVRPELVRELSETGIIAARNENFAIAEELFTALSNLAPERVEGPVNLAIVYEQHAEALDRVADDSRAAEYIDKATATYKRLLQGDDIPSDVLLNAGMFFAKIRNYEEAHRNLSQFVAESDDEEKREHAARLVREIESQNLLDELFKEAYDFIRIGDEETGIARVREFIDRYPHAWNAWFLLGWGQRRIAEYQEAQESFNRAIELGADNADTYNELAICDMELDLYSEAQSHLAMALQREPDNTKVMSNFGVLAMKTGDVAEARRFFLTVLELEPGDPVAARYLAHLDQE